MLPVENRHFNHWNTDPWELDYNGKKFTFRSTKDLSYLSRKGQAPVTQPEATQHAQWDIYLVA